MNILDSKGICKKCQQDAQSEHMECWLCKQKYHVIECEGEDPMVQPSFLRNQWPTINRKWSCITFTCHNCREDANTKQELIMSQRVRVLEEMAQDTNKKLNDLTDALINKKQDASMLHDSGNSYAGVTKGTPSLIIIGEPEKEVSPEVTKNKMEELKKAAIQSKVALKKTYTNRSGKTVVLCNSEKSKEIILPHVNKLFETSKINTPKPKLPTVSVPFIQGQYTKEELMEALNNQNEESGITINKDNAEVIFISPMRDQDKDGLHQAVLRVSEDVREKIKSNGNRIFIGSSSCPVYDRFFVKRCNRCQSFHHYHKECKKEEVCANCAEGHDTRKCNNTGNLKCINCSIGGFENINHCASSFQCPAYILEQDKLKKSINYYSKNS